VRSPTINTDAEIAKWLQLVGDEPFKVTELTVPSNTTYGEDYFVWWPAAKDLPKSREEMIYKGPRYPLGTGYYFGETIDSLHNTQKEEIPFQLLAICCQIQNRDQSIDRQDQCNNYGLREACVKRGVSRWWNWNRVNFMPNLRGHLGSSTDVVSYWKALQATLAEFVPLIIHCEAGP